MSKPTKKTKTVTIKQEKYAAGAFLFSGTIEEFKRGLNAFIEAVPSEYRKYAVIEINSDGGYDGDEVQIEISYERPETEAERSERLAQATRLTGIRESQERAQLAALKAKYEGAAK